MSILETDALAFDLYKNFLFSKDIANPIPIPILDEDVVEDPNGKFYKNKETGTYFQPITAVDSDYGKRYTLVTETEYRTIRYCRNKAMKFVEVMRKLENRS